MGGRDRFAFVDAVARLNADGLVFRMIVPRGTVLGFFLLALFPRL